MKKFCWFAVRHKWTAWLLTGLPIAAIYALMLHDLDNPIPLIILKLAVVLACIYTYITISCPNYLITAAVKKLNEDCDPHPLLQTTEEMLPHIRKGYIRQVLLIDKAAALEELGEAQAALDILLSINIDQYTSMHNLSKVVYYHNLSSLYIMLGQWEHAKIWASKAAQIYADLKNSKLKQQFSYTVQLAEAALLANKDDCHGALAILAKIKPSHRYADVHRAMVHATVCLAMGNTAIAKMHLQYVIEYGNKLYIVTKAKTMLEKL